MNSDNKTVNKAHQLIKDRIEALRVKRQTLKDRIDDKWPEDMYGCKGETMYERKSKELDEEIKLLRAYDSAFYELFEVIEHKDRMEELRKEFENNETGKIKSC